MKDELTIRDLYRFLIDNIKIIISTIVAALIIGVVLAVSSNLNSTDPETQDTSLIETHGLISEEKYKEYAEWPIELFSEPQIRQMQAYLLPKAYKVTVYIEYENHEPIANTTFMREVFRNRDVVNYIENQLGETLKPTIDFAVHIENLSNSGVYELHFQRGSREESLELANIVITAINDGVIPVLDNKNIEFINETPVLVKEDYTEFTKDEENGSGISLREFSKDIILYGFIGVAVGIGAGIIIALFSIIVRKNVTALYDYVRKDTDKVVRLNHLRNVTDKEVLEKGLNNINSLMTKSKIVLFDDKTENEWQELFDKLNENAFKYTDFSNLSEEINEVDEIVILSKVNKTSKNWYNNQRVQLNGYNIPIKIIQF